MNYLTSFHPITCSLAFLGLGTMGYPMAGHLARAGYQVTVYNRTEKKADDWATEYGGRAARTPHEAVQGAAIVAACVGNDDDLREITLGSDGAFSGMVKDAVFVDHTTVSVNVTRELYQTARKRGLHFLDAPVSGGQAGAQNGQLTIMCGGDKAAFACVAPVLRHYSTAVRRIGQSGTGQLAKMVNQICIAGIMQGLAEAINFGERAGLDMPLVLDAIGQGAAASWQLEHRGKAMLEGQYEASFTVDWMRKDLGLCLAQAHNHSVSLPLTALVDQLYAEVQSLGGNQLDMLSLIWRLRKLAQD